MTRKTVHTLIAIVVGLVLLLFVMQRGDRNEIGPGERLLLPGFASVANDVTEVQITRSESEAVVLVRNGERWSVTGRDGYAADLGKLKPLVIALAEAKLLEEKTSLPEQYDKLGVADPENGGSGVKVTLAGPDSTFSVILGDTAREYRYARIADEATSYLIDRSPELPESPGDWLRPAVMDIPAMRVRQVIISHADGETMTIEKSEQEQTDFGVAAVPDGRELSYATVGNGIAGALGALELDDVRKAIDGEAVATTVFETWDDIRVTAAVVEDGDDAWVAFSAEAASDEPAAGEQLATIRERVSGWQYRLADYKKNLLVRRWDDILRSVDEEP